MLYANYATVEEIDHQLSYGQTGPKRDVTYAKFVEAAYRCRETYPNKLDLMYGPADRNRFDIFYTKENPETAPTVLFFHGGGWRVSDKFFANFYAEAYCAEGINFIAATYGFLPQFRLPQIIEHARLCADYVYNNATKLGIDANRLMLSGNSAGAHLAACAWETEWSARGLPERPFHGAILFSGIYDVFINYHSSNWKGYNWSEEEIHACSPGFHVREGLPPLLLFYGGDETDEFKRQSALLHDAAREKGIPSKLEAIPGTDHFSSQWVMHQPESAAYPQAMQFIRDCVPAS